ncbi:hypothetical protein G7046_g825 [Stylonectria norvegica]|nr:hypothetical protein G7046_g825 [Stylonectria norvegica]
MASSYLPFLYQTRTLQRGCRVPIPPIRLFFQRRTYAVETAKLIRSDNSIPFELDEEDHINAVDAEDGAEGPQSTITPSEAEVFKGIFDEISQGRMPKAKKRPEAPDAQSNDPLNRFKQGAHSQLAGQGFDQKRPATSIMEQVRVTQFGEEFLQRYPKSLRKAAELALGKFELAPQRPKTKLRDMTKLDAEEATKLAEWARYERVREAEKQRVATLMGSCVNDVELWEVMEKEVFSLPRKLDITGRIAAVPKPKTTRKSKKLATPKAPLQSLSPAELQGQAAVLAASGEPNKDGLKATEEKLIMDVHGPLYSHFITTGLDLLDTAFPLPSPLAFKILPRIRSLGLPSFVLGVSTPFLARLARIHWNRFGDASSAFEMLEEMKSVGLYADEDVRDLLVQIRDHLHGCTWGAQGAFVMAVMESPPYDAVLTQRLEDAERYMRQSFGERAKV